MLLRTFVVEVPPRFVAVLVHHALLEPLEAREILHFEPKKRKV